jgi:Rad3-related DNA helicase
MTAKDQSDILKGYYLKNRSEDQINSTNSSYNSNKQSTSEKPLDQAIDGPKLISQRIWELFPYEMPEKSQFHMITEIAKSPPRSKILIQNSTGSGKTIASMVGMLARRQKDEKIIVFCRTISQISSFLREWKKVVEVSDKRVAFEKIMGQAAPIIVPLQGKAKMCKMLDQGLYTNFPKEAVSSLCHLIPCNLHISRVNRLPNGKMGVIQANLKLWYNPNPHYFRKITFDKEGQCPYYLQISMLKHADIIIATYPYMQNELLNYLLDIIDVPKEKLMIIVDEAHNLADIDRSEITSDDIEMVLSIISHNYLLNQMKKLLIEDYKNKIISFETIADEFAWEELENIISVSEIGESSFKIEDLIKPEVLKMQKFLRMRHIAHLVIKNQSLIFIRAAPDKWLQSFDKFNLQVYMSGTFKPLYAYRELFGFSEKTTKLLEYDNQSRQSNMFRSFLVNHGMTTKLNRRNKVVYHSMATTILKLYNVSPRHMLVVCPSYSILTEVFNHTKESLDQPVTLIREELNMDLAEIQKAIDRSSDKIILFGVSSGKFSEGIEIVRSGHSLISTLIFVGLPFRKPDQSIDNIIKQVRSKTIGSSEIAKAFDLLIPLLRLIDQAFGRTVRTSVDKGAMIILDYRAESIRSVDKSLRRYSSLERLIRDLNTFFKDYQSINQVQLNSK